MSDMRHFSYIVFVGLVLYPHCLVLCELVELMAVYDPPEFVICQDKAVAGHIVMMVLLPGPYISFFGVVHGRVCRLDTE